MSRLNYMQDHESAILIISEEMGCLEKALRAGQKLDQRDAHDLLSCFSRLEKILRGIEANSSEGWQNDEEPLPSWLQPNQARRRLIAEDEEPGAAIK